ncbi:MAG: molybdenum cofactor guanylyltransferase [Methanoregula sp.]
MRSAIILVGGEARRANGQEKYFFQYQGKTFLDRLLSSLRQVVDECVLVARDTTQCTRFAGIGWVRCIADIRGGIGPIGGLHAGSLEAQGDLVFVSACDMPCVDPTVVAHLFDAIGDFDAAIPIWNPDMLEPLHAVYRRTALLSYLASHNSLSLRKMVHTLNSRFIPVDELRAFDPDLVTFTNINKIEELEKINGAMRHL